MGTAAASLNDCCCAGTGRPWRSGSDDAKATYSCDCETFARTGTCKHVLLFDVPICSVSKTDKLPGVVASDVGDAIPSGPSCSCQAFKTLGSCRHLPPSLGGVERTPPAKQEERDEKEPEEEPPRRLVDVDWDRSAWYLNEAKSLAEAVASRRRGQRKSSGGGGGGGGGACGVFLDVDGVLHPLGAFGKDTFSRWSLLLQLLKATDCEVVLSSSWRLEPEGVQELNDRLRESGAPELLDLCPKPKAPFNDLGNRDVEIRRWMERHAAEVGWGERWVAVDDLDLGPALGAHAVVTDGEVGLTEAKVQEAIAKLRR